MAGAIKRIIARKLAAEMKRKKITKKDMAERMRTSRAQLDRLLDPENNSVNTDDARPGRDSNWAAIADRTVVVIGA